MYNILLIAFCVYIVGNPLKEHPAVPLEEILWLNNAFNIRDSVAFHKGLLLLRRKLFPFEHNPHSWITGI